MKILPTLLLGLVLFTSCDQPRSPAESQPSQDTSAPPPARDPSAITIEIEAKNLQAITQWGLATQNRPEWGPAYNIAVHPQSLDAIYGELGTTMLRVGIPYETFDKPKSREALKQGILAATSRGLAWYGLPWSPPVSMKTLKSPNGRVGKELNRLKPGSEAEVAAWLVDLVKWLVSEGVPLPYGLSPQNEPDFGPPGYPGCIYSAEQIQTAVVELRKALDAAGFSNVKVIADEGAKPADDGYPKADPDSGTINMLGLAKGGAFQTDTAYRDALDIIATHTYDLHNGLYEAQPGYMQDWRNVTADTGKELWMTEWETRHEHTHSDWGVIAETMSHFNRDISSMGFNGWFTWQVWRGQLLGDGTNDPGQCVARIRPTDTLSYKAIDLGQNPEYVDLRISADSDKMRLAIHLDRPDGEKIGEIAIPASVRKDRDFTTVRVPLQPVSGAHDVHLVFSSPEHWREASLNWLQFAGGPVLEAEAFTSQITSEKWSSSIADCYQSGNRHHWVLDDGKTLQKRPLYYIFKKLWKSAPAGADTHVRRVVSSNSRLRGESTEADPANFRQDLVAFVTGGRTTLLILNRNEQELAVDLKGLTGSSAELFRYEKGDTESVNQDLTSLKSVPLQGGKMSGLMLPPESLTFVVSQ